MTMTRNAPIPYRPDVEQPEDDEQRIAGEIDATMAKIRTTTYSHSGHAIRSVHAKSIGLLRGELVVADGLSADLAQGIAAKPGRHPVVVRLSTVPGDIVDDDVSTPRGMALKVLGVEGERLPGSEGAATQDFVLVNGPTFSAPNTKRFLSNLKLLAATTDKAEGAKKALSATLQRVEKLVELFGAKSTTLVSLGGQPETHPLGETYFSQAALRWGAYMAKVAVTPVSAPLQALKDAKVDLDGRPDGLREEVVSFFARNGGEWELRVQLCTDLDKMPIENASIEWSEDESPYVTVARLSVPSQTAWSVERSQAVDDGMSFSVWHGLAAHRPLGSVMRARKLAYEASARFRAEKNGRAMEEPRDLSGFPA